MDMLRRLVNSLLLLLLLLLLLKNGVISVFVNVDMGLWSFKIIESGTIQKLAYGFLLVNHRNCLKCTVFEIFACDVETLVVRVHL